MKSIKVSILGKEYPLKVEDSEEESMKRIAQYVDEKFRQYKKELNKQPDTTIMTLAALSIAEELFEERKRNRELDQKGDEVLENVNKSLEEFIEELQ
jgi:cell division protein ZapA